MSFSTTDAAFEGFRLVRERPRTLLAWAGYCLVLGLTINVLLITLAGPEMSLLAGLGPNPSQSQVAPLLGPLLKLYAILIPLAVVGGSVFACAVYRAVLRPDDGGAAFLKLGADELRLIGLSLLVVLILFGGMFVAVFTIGLVIVAAQTAAPGAAALASVLGFTAMTVAAIWIGVRLSLAAPMTFVERRIRIAAAWRLTRGRFWRILGAYLLAAVFSIIVMTLGLVIATALGVVVGGGMAATKDIFDPDFNSLQSYFTPVRFGYILIASLITAMQYVIVLSAPAVIYDELSKAGLESPLRADGGPAGRLD